MEECDGLHQTDFLLLPEEIPVWRGPPSKDAIVSEYKLDWVFWTNEYWQKGIFGNEKEVLRIMNAPPQLKAPSTGVIFDIGEYIALRKRQDSLQGDYISTSELLALFETENVRPASLKELLVFSKKYWKPIPNYPDQPLPIGEVIPPANSPYVYALGSLFSDADGHDRVPYLYGRMGERGLEAEMFSYDWSEKERFLVFPI